ncbi:MULTISPECIES: hypothetical protein [Pseudomonadota]|uniref:hypothetical protein n=1 Tax=Pseudomonadota TaxID=1224 RepID=UPI0029433AD3|nr:hypothetical protein [Marinobacter salarius]WOI17730.1 hypothetical protein R1T46_13095 [Marinobacter salarius]
MKISLDKTKRIAVCYQPNKLSPLYFERCICIHNSSGKSLFCSSKSVFLPGDGFPVIDQHLISLWDTPEQNNLAVRFTDALISVISKFSSTGFDKHELKNSTDILYRLKVGKPHFWQWSSHEDWLKITAKILFDDDEPIAIFGDTYIDSRGVRCVKNLCVLVLSDLLNKLGFSVEPILEPDGDILIDSSDKTSFESFNGIDLLSPQPFAVLVGNLIYDPNEKSWDELAKIVNDIRSKAYGINGMRVFHQYLSRLSGLESQEQVLTEFLIAREKFIKNAEDYGLKVKEGNILANLSASEEFLKFINRLTQENGINSSFNFALEGLGVVLKLIGLNKKIKKSGYERFFVDQILEKNGIAHLMQVEKLLAQ